MNWSDERYVRLYTRDTPDWQCLSFLAQGLFCLLLRKVDRAGTLPLGRAGRKAVAIAVGHPGDWARLEPALDELLADGCIAIEGDMLVLPNFIEAQEAEASDKARAKKHRELVRDLAKTGQKAPSRGVTQTHENGTSRDGTVTTRDAGVTACNETVTPNQTSLTNPPKPLASVRLLSPQAGHAEKHPATARLLNLLLEQGAPGEWPRDAATRASVEALLAGRDLGLVAVAVADSIRASGKAHLGWHRDAMRQPSPRAAPIDTDESWCQGVIDVNRWRTVRANIAADNPPAEVARLVAEAKSRLLAPREEFLP